MITRLTEADILDFVSSLPGVVVVTASQANAAPEVAWGDSFFFYDPERNTAPERRLPFATLVTSDYPGFDTASNLNRPGVFRLNIGVSRETFEALFGYPPAQHADHQADFDYGVLDQILPHPAYAAQAWVSILNPGKATDERGRSLIVAAHARAVERHRPS